MNPKHVRARAILVLAIVILLAVTTLGARHYHAKEAAAIAAIYAGTRPVSKNAPSIPTTSVNQLVSQDFQIVTDLGYVPSIVKDSFCNVEHCNFAGVKFDMVNPGAAIRPGRSQSPIDLRSSQQEFRRCAPGRPQAYEDFYSVCTALAGFGLAIEVQMPHRMVPTGRFVFRPSSRGLRLLDLLQ
jgi:hypothetical protein